MLVKRAMTTSVVLAGAALVVACSETTVAPVSEPAEQPILTSALDEYAGEALDPAAVQFVIDGVDEFNAQLAAAGSDLRLDYPWLFRIGNGVDPFGALRTGSRWVQSEPTYILDASDYTPQVPAGDVDAALVSSFDSWNDIANTDLTAMRIADTGGNFDVIDGTIIGGQCFSLFDLTSPNLDLANGVILPEADIVMGGWEDPAYFASCLGSNSIIGVTWTFSGPDTNGDNYPDRQYVEQFYNERFSWVTSGAVFLGPGTDIETIAAHENGHAHGLGHFGGPIANQPFKLKPNGRVYNPEAVMNPFYLGGEKRTPLPTDVAGLRTLYSGHVGR